MAEDFRIGEFLIQISPATSSLIAMTYRLFFLGWILLQLFSIGCGGPKGIPREPVSGTVTLDGATLEEGAILLIPIGTGPTVGGEVRGGRFQLSREDGPSPGKYRVELSAWRATGKFVEDAAIGGAEEQLVSIIPPRYNEKSELEIDVEQGKENSFEFDLSSK